MRDTGWGQGRAGRRPAPTAGAAAAAGSIPTRPSLYVVAAPQPPISRKPRRGYRQEKPGRHDGAWGFLRPGAERALVNLQRGGEGGVAHDNRPPGPPHP
jgi:hypothetical protein